MKLAMKLTLDGLLQALRATVHQIADDLESGHARKDGVIVNDLETRSRRGGEYDIGKR